ncbi:Phytosulfokine [Artemisia annua]|uniref:Phytosulfokine n=1 Tax=Artemisia annua TaxID=35608 RepID=A0A2U1NR42_ARTAN|nr:Phytosulfokine [Artemisia annua]
MSRTTTLLLIALLLCSTTSYAARHMAADTTTRSHQNEGGGEPAEIEEGCEGIGEEECLMRRTLIAHIDYIYTQNKTP